MGKQIMIFFMVTVALVGVVTLMANYDNWFIQPVFSSSAIAKHLVVISLDAVSTNDFETLKTLPNMKGLIENGSYASEVKSVYPSLTYPAHVSISTGNYPDKHGVIANERLQPEENEKEWYSYANQIKSETFYGLARKSGLKVGNIFWPGTGNADINYNLPEIKAIRGENQLFTLIKNGSPLFLTDLNFRFGEMTKGVHQPELDNFATESTKYLINTKKPNLVLTHLTDVDTHKHYYGVASSQVKAALLRQDTRVGEIINATKQAGILEDTVFVVLGDHGQADVNKIISINSEFKKAGLINTDQKGNITGWKAILQTLDGSAYIYLKESSDQETLQKVDEILTRVSAIAENGIEKVYKREDLKALHVDPNAMFLLEAKSGFYFSEAVHKALITDLVIAANRDQSGDYAAMHGYSPDKKEMSTFLVIQGPGIKKGAINQKVSLVDEGPTMAQILGLNMIETDGKVIAEIFDK